ncbi:MAG: polysaccharide biosynthesis/export family protein [Acidobacteriia bacterium]|nr:polysaccharide biosynthesis/export family protein [Terriglobia bacterium]
MKLFALLLAAAIAASAQSPPVMEDATRPNLPHQIIGINDLISLSVYRSPELTRTVRVEEAGAITLPLLAKPIHAAGLLPGDLESQITAALKSQGILANPLVKVTVAEYASRPVSVIGAVKKPLTFQATGRVTLLDALARAEGLTPESGAEIILSRSSSKEPPLRISVHDLMVNALPELNHLLTGGEEIRVPEAPRIFVAGNVRKPGSYPLRNPADGTVMRVIAVAEGLIPFAGKTAYIYRQGPDPLRPSEIPVELSKILERKAPDQLLLPNDLLYITDNKGRRAAMTVIDRATGFAVSTASGVLIWRR